MQTSSSVLLSPIPGREILFTSSTDRVRVTLMSDEPGLVEFGGSARTIVSIHVGPAAVMTCRRGGVSHTGNAVHGDIDLIPAFVPGTWELKQKDTALVVGLEPELLQRAAEELDAIPPRLKSETAFRRAIPAWNTLHGRSRRKWKADVRAGGYIWTAWQRQWPRNW